MSWLGSLAAKTETLLNKVDQVAGQALQNEKNETFNQFPVVLDQFQSSQTFSKESKQQSHNLPNDIAIPKRNNSSTKLSKMDAKKDPEAELFEFLNDTKTINSSQPPQASNLIQATTETKTATPPKSQQQHVEKKKSESSSKPATASTEDLSIVRENQLLKDEIHSLNRELMSIASRGKATQEEYNKAASKLESERRNVSQRETTIRELRERELDVQNSILAKDSQLSVLRIRLEEADLDLKMKVSQIEKFQSEKNNILEDHSLSTGVQSQALDSLQARSRELEGILKSEQDKKNKLETDMRGLMAGFEAEKNSHASEMTALQRRLTTEKSRSCDHQNQLKLARSQADLAKQELLQYKQKATRILQSKEKLIGKLKETSSTASSVDGSGASEPNIQVTEMESLRSERDMLREDLASTQLSLETVKAEYADLEMQSEQDVEGLREQIGMMEEEVVVERRRKQEVEVEVAGKMNELKYLHEELLSQKSMFHGRLHEREAEVGKLRNQLTTKCLNASSHEELESRLHVLTESLIQKQTHLESLSSERNSLVLQLERVEKQYREAESIAMRKSSSSLSSSAINISDDDDVRSRFSNLMHESPFDGKVARNVKKAANSIDRFSMRLGLFLRRYPSVRVFICIYMVLLHVWVMVVLLTYEPEVHHPDYKFPHAPADPL